MCVITLSPTPTLLIQFPADIVACISFVMVSIGTSLFHMWLTYDHSDNVENCGYCPLVELNFFGGRIAGFMAVIKVIGLALTAPKTSGIGSDDSIDVSAP